MGASGRPETLNNILKPIISRVGLGWRIKEYKILEEWVDIVGQDMAANTQPVKVRGGVLHVKVSNSIWMQQLQFIKEKILNKINRRLAEVFLKDIWFFIGEIPPKNPPGQQEQREKKGSGERAKLVSQVIQKEIASEIRQIKDPEIKELLISIYIKNKIIKDKNA